MSIINRLNKLEKELEKVKPKNIPVMFMDKILLDKYSIKYSPDFVKIAYIEDDKTMYLPEKENDL